MKKIMLGISFTIFLLGSSLVFAQMGGMMGGQQGQMMGTESSQKPQAQSIGAKLFGDNCSGCHPNGGNIIVPNLPLKGSRVLATYKDFTAFIRSPKMPDGSQGAMPAFPESKITDQQAKELYHFVKSERYGARGGYGYGMGPGMMGGYGMGPGMMGGYGMGFYSQTAECVKFYDETAKLRRELNDKRFEYFEAIRDPKTPEEKTANLQKEITELRQKIHAKAPLDCWW